MNVYGPSLHIVYFSAPPPSVPYSPGNTLTFFERVGSALPRTQGIRVKSQAADARIQPDATCTHTRKIIKKRKKNRKKEKDKRQKDKKYAKRKNTKALTPREEKMGGGGGRKKNGKKNRGACVRAASAACELAVQLAP